MNIPNILTIIRLILVPVFAIAFYNEGDAKIISVIIFLVASATDVADGYIARKYNLSTKLGQLLDPLADKLMQLMVIMCLAFSGRLPVWFVIILAIKELLLIIGGTFLYIKKTYVKANILGKLYTIVLFAVLVSLMAFPAYSKVIEYILLIGVAFIGMVALLGYCYSYLISQKQFKKYIKKGENIK